MMTDKNFKIALFAGSLRGGGAERMMINLSQGFVENGFKVDLVLAAAKGPYLSQVPSEVTIIDLKSSRVLYSIWGLARYLRRVKPTVLLSTEAHVNIAALLAKKIAHVGTRVILRVANTISEYFSRKNFKTQVIAKIMPFIYLWADRYVAVSKGVADDMIQSLGIPEEHVHVVYNPVVTEEILEKTEDPISHSWFNLKGVPVILGAGRLSLQKDFATLIRAFSILRGKRTAKLIILGEGKELENLKTLVSQLEIEKDVDFPGFVDNPFAYMKRSKLFVLSSIYEGLPGVLIQAMACGCPVISTDCPSGPREILENGKYGPLVPVGDPSSMANAMLNMLDKKIDTNFLVQRSNEFSLDKAVKGYLSVFMSVI